MEDGKGNVDLLFKITGVWGEGTTGHCCSPNPYAYIEKVSHSLIAVRAEGGGGVRGQMCLRHSR